MAKFFGQLSAVNTLIRTNESAKDIHSLNRKEFRHLR